MLAASGAIKVLEAAGGGRLLRWRGPRALEYRPSREMLTDGGGMWITPAGYTLAFEGTRVHLTTSEKGVSPRFGTGQFDYTLLDIQTGLMMGCRGFVGVTLDVDGLNGPKARLRYPEDSGWYDHGYGNTFDVTFGRRGLSDLYDKGRNDVGRGYFATAGGVRRGELMLDAKPPRCLARRVRRFIRAGAVEMAEGSGMLMLRADSPAEWPPKQRERGPRPRAGAGEHNWRHEFGRRDTW